MRASLILAQELARRNRENKLASYTPYEKQLEFHTAGAQYRERLFMAGNQLGKTWAGGYEAAMHLTGNYPEWWQGKRFKRPVKMWIGAPTGEFIRDNSQRILFGEVGELGTGTVPKSAIIGEPTKAHGTTGLFDTVRVRHISGGVSIVKTKSYDQGRIKWQGTPVDVVWNDEESPIDIYLEGLTRTNATKGIVFTTFTPLLGMSDTVMRFLGDDKAPDTHVTNMTIEDALHYTREERDRIIASYPAHEREARVKGIPMLGSGRVFPIPEEAITVAPFAIPNHWPQIGCLDFGWDHPFAAAKLAWDRDTDTIYVTKTYRIKEQTPVIHVAALRAWGEWLPFAWPHDGLQHDKGSGEQLADQYRKAGLNMLAERATFADGTNGVEAGVMEMLTRMETARFKVFSTETDYFEEHRLYHREDGKIVKLRDDIISAVRYGIMMLRHAVVKPVNKPLKYQKLGTI